MIRTEYICDNCGHAQPTNTQMGEIEVRLRHHEGVNNFSTYNPPVKTALWCRKCCEAYEFLLRKKGLENILNQPKELNLEDLLRKIVREEIEEAS